MPTSRCLTACLFVRAYLPLSPRPPSIGESIYQPVISGKIAAGP
uniref:Uncharacterized protein n=1 Tax=Rhizophora mucronata TaxID=61149 RepID=A0A2P2JQD0_RHIMU